ncbi:MAG TPA: insulinase family protein [Lacunisphaera sp.]|jgi:zinc protease|nr:insulinase family protein [Lacunisphaera sp.]HQY05636.1 insulinase family protein [Lacunisphaera sp.]
MAYLDAPNSSAALRARRVYACALWLLAPLLVWAADFPHESSDLPVNPAVTWGRLDNGLRYALLPNAEPQGRISVRLAVRVGSIYENDAQRGLAHFLEHMAFNGSRHFPAAQVVEFFQRLGMDFGGDTNAATGFDRTIYQLELPDTKPETLRESLTFLADVAGGLRLDPKAIEKERGIILSEKRARDSVGLRTFLAELEFLVPDTRFPQRLPIGTDKVITTADRDRFVSFYDAWYRPERMILVLVGDLSPDAVTPLVRELFAPLAARSPTLPEPRLGTVTLTDEITAHLHTEKEAGNTTVALETVAPYKFEPDNSAARLRDLPRTLALQMLNRRLSVLAKQPGAPFLSGLVGVTEQFDFFRNASIELNCRPDQWSAALAVAEQELRRALEHGFLPEELAEAVAGMKNQLAQAVRTAPTRRSPTLADALVDDILGREVTLAPAAELALYSPALATSTPADCLAALRATWSEAAGRKLFVSGNLELSGAAQKIAAAYQTSQRNPVSPPVPTATAAFAYTDFGKPGKVDETASVEDLGVTLLEFKNGVRLNLKPTDYEAGSIRVSVRLGGGTLTLPRAQPGLGLLANVAFTTGGLGRHSVDDLQRLLAGRTVGLAFGAQADAFTFAATTNRQDLLLQLQLFCAYLTDPGYRPESLRQVQKLADQTYRRLAHTAEGPLQLEAASLLANGDPRFGLPPKDVLLARTLDELKAWLTPQFAKGPIEIAIVGDLDPDATIAAVASTFGALPKRQKKPAYKKERTVAKLAEPISREFPIESAIPKALVRLYWPATDAHDVRLARRLRLLSGILADRLRVKIREEMGGTYSPNAGADLSETYPGYGYLIADATVAPGQTRAVAAAIRAVAAALHTDGVTEEELLRAKEPTFTALRESTRDNTYWLNAVLADAQEFPARLDWCRTRYSDTEAVTATELSALAKEYLDPARASEFIVVPEQTKPAQP